MNKQSRLAKKTATRMTRELELQLKRGEIHIELLDTPAEVESFLNETK